MPRDGSGVYSIPDGTEGVPDATILSEKYNIFIHDVEQDANVPRPIVAGGTGASDAGSAMVALGGERAGEVVTNYDSHVFRPGSFYSATTALGSPASAHAFSGVCYMSDVIPPTGIPPNLNLVIEARDMTDTVEPGALWVRRKKAGVWGAWTATAGTSSGAAAAVGCAPVGNVSATNVQAAIGELDSEKAPAVNANLTGTPTASSPAVNDNTGRIATTSWVMGQAANTNPVMDGSVSQGSATRWARADHVHPSDTSRLATAGGTLTGLVTVSYASPRWVLSKTAGGQAAQVEGQTNGVLRWVQQLGDATAEGGSNAGSDYKLLCYNDAGTLLFTPMSVKRSTGEVTFNPGPVTIDVAGGGNLNLNKTTNGGNNILRGKRNNNTRWELCLGDFNSEAGSDAGSDFSLYSFSDAGSLKILTMQSNRANGNFFVGANALKSGGGPWTDSSDERIKTIEGAFTRGLDEIAQLSPVVYTFNGNETNEPPIGDVEPYRNSPHYLAAKDGKRFAGLIAQEVEDIFPEMVTQRKGFIDGNPVTDLRDLDTGPLIFALINCVKELKQRVEDLEAARP